MNKTVYLTWKRDTLPSILQTCVDSFSKHCHGWELRFFNDSQCVDFIQERMPEFLPCYLSYAPGILRADVFRVLVLYICGGVYADIDIECLQSLDVVLDQMADLDWELLLTRDHPIHERIHYAGRPMWMNDFMFAKKGSRFLEAVLNAYRLQNGESVNPMNAVHATGPGLFSSIIEAAGGPQAVGVHYIPWEWVHPLPDMTNSFEEKETYELAINSREWLVKNNPIVVHYWYHTWCATKTMLRQYPDILLTKNETIIDSRLLDIADNLGASIDVIGLALTEFAVNQGRTIVELTMNSDKAAYGAAQRTFRRVCAEAFKGIACTYVVVEAGATAACSLNQATPTPSEANSGPVTLGTLIGTGFKILSVQGGLKGVSEVLDGPIDLLYLPDISADEVYNRECLDDFQQLTASELLKHNGLILVEQYNSKKSALFGPLEIGFLSGFRTVASGAQLLIEKIPDKQFEIPKVLHVVLEADGEGLCDASYGTSLGEDWTIRTWHLRDIERLLEDRYPDDIDAVLQIQPSRARHRVMRYILAQCFGGVVIPQQTVIPENLDTYLTRQRLILFTGEGVAGTSARHICTDIIASVANHEFWQGMNSDWTSGTSCQEFAGEYLRQRIEVGKRYLKPQDLPVIANRPCRRSSHILFNPNPTESHANATRNYPARYDDVFPSLTDKMVQAYSDNATEEERSWLDELFQIQDIVGAREGADVVAVNLYGLTGNEDFAGAPGSDSKMVVSFRDCHAARWSNNLAHLLHGAAELKRTFPQTILRVYLDKQLDFLVSELANVCEVRLMAYAAKSSQPAGLWRLLAIGDNMGSVTLSDTDKFSIADCQLVKRTASLEKNLGMTWRSPVAYQERDERGCLAYKPISSTGFGTLLQLPIEKLLKAFIWHSRQSSLPTHTIHPVYGEVPFQGTEWPGYRFDEWFLSWLYGHFAREGIVSYVEDINAAIMLPLDLAFLAGQNPRSSIVLGKRGNRRSFSISAAGVAE